ncbi:MAG: hypothetical protein JF589_14915 [Gemmatimonadetes bacterium]|nr:hypothetical protein [Gemmatimonadota bacterium]
MTETERNRATVARLIDILSGKSPIECGVELIAPDVVANVDGWRFAGINVWANWILYLRTRECVDGLTLFVDQLAVNEDGTVTVRGCWSAMQGERRVFSKSCSARYRLEHGRIVEIWSTRRNYAFMCGAHTESRPGFAIELLRAWWWKTRAPQLDLTGGERVRAVGFLSPATAQFAGD